MDTKKSSLLLLLVIGGIVAGVAAVFLYSSGMVVDEETAEVTQDIDVLNITYGLMAVFAFILLYVPSVLFDRSGKMVGKYKVAGAGLFASGVGSFYVLFPYEWNTQSALGEPYMSGTILLVLLSFLCFLTPIVKEHFDDPLVGDKKLKYSKYAFIAALVSVILAFVSFTIAQVIIAEANSTFYLLRSISLALTSVGVTAVLLFLLLSYPNGSGVMFLGVTLSLSILAFSVYWVYLWYPHGYHFGEMAESVDQLQVHMGQLIVFGSMAYVTILSGPIKYWKKESILFEKLYVLGYNENQGRVRGGFRSILWVPVLQVLAAPVGFPITLILEAVSDATGIAFRELPNLNSTILDMALWATTYPAMYFVGIAIYCTFLSKRDFRTILSPEREFDLKLNFVVMGLGVLMGVFSVAILLLTGWVELSLAEQATDLWFILITALAVIFTILMVYSLVFIHQVYLFWEIVDSLYGYIGNRGAILGGIILAGTATLFVSPAVNDTTLLQMGLTLVFMMAGTILYLFTGRFSVPCGFFAGMVIVTMVFFGLPFGGFTYLHPVFEMSLVGPDIYTGGEAGFLTSIPGILIILTTLVLSYDIARVVRPESTPDQIYKSYDQTEEPDYEYLMFWK